MLNFGVERQQVRRQRTVVRHIVDYDNAVGATIV